MIVDESSRMDATAWEFSYIIVQVIGVDYVSRHEIS